MTILLTIIISFVAGYQLHGFLKGHHRVGPIDDGMGGADLWGL
jgi:hypothetical protein